MDYSVSFKLKNYTPALVRQRVRELDASLPLEEKIALANEQMGNEYKLQQDLFHSQKDLVMFKHDDIVHFKQQQQQYQMLHKDLSAFLTDEYVHKILAILFLLPIFFRPAKRKYDLTAQIKHELETYLESVDGTYFYYHKEFPCKWLLNSPIFPPSCDDREKYGYICRESVVLALMIHGFKYQFNTRTTYLFNFLAEPVKRLRKETAYNFLMDYELPLPPRYPSKMLIERFQFNRKRRQDCERLYTTMLCVKKMKKMLLPKELWQLIALYLFT